MLPVEQFERTGCPGAPAQKPAAVLSGISSGWPRTQFRARQRRRAGHRIVSGFLLDANCVFELVRVKPDPRVLKWMEAVDESLLYLSVLTLGEIRKGLAALAQGRRRTQLEAWLEVDLRGRFSGRNTACRRGCGGSLGLLAAQARRTGATLPIVDGLLAATAASTTI